jgi:hypothetical protein
MRYLYNPKTNELDDIETPKLGEKYFASAETDEIIRQINDQFGPGTLFPASEAPQPEIKTPQAVFEFGQRNPAAEGGMMRQKYSHGAEVMTLNPLFPTKDMDSDDFQPLDVPGMLIPAGVATALAAALNVDTDYIKENPEILETLQAKAIMLSMGIVTQGVKDNVSESIRATGLGLGIGPDANEIEKEKEKIRELTKPVGFPGDYIDPGLTTGGQEIPEQTKQEPPVTGGIIEFPPSTGGTEIIEPKKGDNIFNRKETDINDLKNKKGKKTLIDILDKQKETIPNFDKLDKKSQEKFIKSIEKKITSLPQNQAYTEPALSKDYVNVLKNYVETHHDGNITVAATELGFDKQKKRNINARLSKIGFEGKGFTAEATLDIADGELKYVDAIKQIKDNPKIYISNVKKLIKEKGLSNKDYVSAIDLANIFNIDGLTVLERTQLLKRLNSLDVKRKKGTQGGRAVKYHLGDALNKLTNYAKTKQAAPGEAVDAVEIRRSREFDKDQNNAVSAVKKTLLDRATNSDIVLPGESLAKDKGHAASLETMAKFPEYFTKDSNTTTFQSYINQDPTINQDFLMGKGYHKIESGIFQRLKDKKINKDEANNLLKENWDNIQRLIKREMRTTPFLRDQGSVVPLLQLDKNSVVQADMSTVDSYFIYGNIDKINPKAKKFSDLSKKQQSQYLSNVKEQYTEGAVKFLTNLKDDKTGERIYSKEEIDNYEEMLSVPLDKDKDARRIYKFAAGGVVPDQEIMNYVNGGRINYEDGSPKGPNEPEGDAFLNKLEFNFNNIDDVTLDDEPITFDDSKSKIAQFNDLIDYKNIPYIGDMAAQAALRVGEFGTRIIPATGELVSDLIRKPLFKGPGAESDTFDPEGRSVMLNGEEQFLDVKQKASSYERDPIADYTNPVGKDAKFVGGPVFRNFLENITPTSTEKLVGLDTLINEEKKKMIARGDSSLMVKVGETASLGGELIAPVFPGLKLFKAYASAKGLKTNKETGKLLEQEIDQMAAANGMNRREFLVATGAVGTLGIAKLLGIAGELPKIAKVTEAVTSVAKNADGVPEYLYDLMRVMRVRGKLQPSSSAFLDGQEVYTYKGVTLYHNTYPKDGSFKIAKEFETNSSVPGEPSYNKVEMEVNSGGDVVVDEGLSTQKVTKAADEYEEATAYPAREGGEDMDFYVDDEYHKQLKEIADELDEINQKIEMFGYDK